MGAAWSSELIAALRQKQLAMKIPNTQENAKAKIRSDITKVTWLGDLDSNQD
jgi:hypothetical protein